MIYIYIFLILAIRHTVKEILYKKHVLILQNTWRIYHFKVVNIWQERVLLVGCEPVLQLKNKNISRL